MVVVLMAVLMAVGRIPQAAVSRCGMQLFYWQEELPVRQAEVDRLHAVADAAGHQYLVARYPEELHAITHGMDLPRPFRLQFFDYNADRQHKQVRKSTPCARMHAYAHQTRTHMNAPPVIPTPLVHHVVGTEGLQQKHQGRS